MHTQAVGCMTHIVCCWVFGALRVSPYRYPQEIAAAPEPQPEKKKAEPLEGLRRCGSAAAWGGGVPRG